MLFTEWGWVAGSGPPGSLGGLPLQGERGWGTRRSTAPGVRCPDWTVRDCPSVQVKRAVVQVISAMAHHGYLEQPGGEAMLEYIVQQCALPPDAEVRPPAPARTWRLCWGAWALRRGGWRGGCSLGLCAQQTSLVSSQGLRTPAVTSSAAGLRRESQDRHTALFGALLLKTLLRKSQFLLEGEQGRPW